MARIPLIDLSDPAISPELAALNDSIVKLRGSPHNIQRALANRPKALGAFMEMSRYIREECSLDPRLRELAVLATAYAQNVPYEIYHHLRAARRAGVPEEQIAAFPNWMVSNEFDAVERAVLTYADQLARRLDVDDATFEELSRHMSPGELTDLALTVGWYHLCSAFVTGLHIEPDEERS